MPGPALAEWSSVGAGDLALLLEDRDVRYGDLAWERHESNGILLFRTVEGPFGRTSLGQWRLEGNMRCLRWNRAAEWECYRVEIDGAGGIRFIDAWDNVSEGRLVPRGE
jgi:hypothetical protein